MFYAPANQISAPNQDGSFNSPNRLATSGAVIVLAGTGGLLAQAVPDRHVMETNLISSQAQAYVGWEDYRSRSHAKAARRVW
jgi:hypothetical protein